MGNVHLDNYLRVIVVVLPATLERLELEISRREKQFSAMSDPDKDELLGLSYLYSTNQLWATCDALRTLEFLSHKSPETLQVNVTQNGVAGLLRQALEALATFDWLNDYSSNDTAEKKAHSYQLADLNERANYYRDLGDDSEYQQTLGYLESARKLGLERGYTRKETDSRGKVILSQEIALLGPTVLCMRIFTPSSVITAEVLKHYRGMENASWLYRWSSGLAHGKYWVNLFSPAKGDLKKTVPNYLNLSVLLLTLISQIDLAIGTN